MGRIIFPTGRRLSVVAAAAVLLLAGCTEAPPTPDRVAPTSVATATVEPTQSGAATATTVGDVNGVIRQNPVSTSLPEQHEPVW